jgi:beta-lactamase class A
MRSPSIAPFLLFLAASVVAAACSRPTRPLEATAASAGTPPARAAEPDRSATVPDTPVGAQLRWVLDVVERGGAVTEAEVRDHFDDTFLTAVPAPKIVMIFGQLAAQLPPIRITAVDATTPNGLAARADTAGGKLLVTITVVPSGGKIGGLVFRPDVPEPEVMASLDELGGAVQKLAPQVSFLAAEIDQGRCVPIHAIDAEQRLAIGSTFKLYVLAAVADRILAKRLAWDRPISIVESLKSLPSGTMQEEPAGTKFPVETYAKQMISISDNTATDHLLHAVGRKAVEAVVEDSGHGEPSRNIPFLSTRELFLMKLDLTEVERERYLAMSPAKRRVYLDRTLAGRRPTGQGAGDWSVPRQIDSLEWFASGTDLCRIMAGLALRGEKEAARPLLDVLSVNPGLNFDRGPWPFVGFKGGSEPGVMNLTWLLRRDDGRWFVATFGFNDPARALDETKILAVVPSVFKLLAGHDR